jgi:hypothetical protein
MRAASSTFLLVTTGPIQLNQQCPGVGTQYRSEIFAMSPKGQRLCQMVGLAGDVTDHTFELRLLGSGALVYSFAFG